jgi:hypothetical protein
MMEALNVMSKDEDVDDNKKEVEEDEVDLCSASEKGH